MECGLVEQAENEAETFLIRAAKTNLHAACKSLNGESQS